MKTQELQTLFTLLKMKNRPLKKAEYIDRFMEVPINGHINTPHFYKAKAKEVGITGLQNTIIRKLKDRRPDILYRIMPQSAKEWYGHIIHTIQQNDLVALNEAQIALIPNNLTLGEPQPVSQPATATANSTHTVEAVVQTNIALSQCLSLNERIVKDLKCMSTLLKTGETVDMDSMSWSELGKFVIN